VVRAEGLEPSRAIKLNGFSYRLRLSPPGRGILGAHPSDLRSGLSLHSLPEHPGLRCCPSSLYTFPAGRSLQAWLGIATPAFAGASLGFPEFEQFCIAGFPDEHSSFLKSVASAGFATPRGGI
jgi:hypothetical protein